MAEEKSLVLKFEPSTIEHLGVKMYSHIPPALAELVANSYDACAKNVSVKLYNTPEKQIIVEDDGCGMTFDEVNDYFLRIGRNRRKENQPIICPDRIPTGKKGLGKLALFGLGNSVEIQTIKNNQKVTFTLNYQNILHAGSQYLPNFEIVDCDEPSGTTITLKELKHKSSFSHETYAKSLARLFNFRANNFILNISLDNGVPIQIDNKLKFENLVQEFEWTETWINSNMVSSYQYKDLIKGKIITTEKPIKPELRGIILFANGRLVNAPEFFGKSESSHFFSYTTGYFDVDFVDEWEEDVIATNRQSIDWELEKSQQLKDYFLNALSAIEKDWRKKRENKREDLIQQNTGINISQWKSTLPDFIESNVETILNKVKTSELESIEQSNFVKALYNIAPEYPLLHWRHLHQEVREVSKTHYQNGYYYAAFIEALKRYVSAVKKKAKKANIDERNLMQAAFNGLLKVTKKYKKLDGSDFEQRTIQNIEEAQKMLSEGIVVGGRHPLQHEEHEELRISGLFTEKDCLDLLSLLSHLFKRLDDADEAP